MNVVNPYESPPCPPEKFEGTQQGSASHSWALAIVVVLLSLPCALLVGIVTGIMIMLLFA